uniref:RdRp n=1 Tax=viral metagenome TaxID=1070528 RepID=A0A2V0RLR7_9ZZZZ
MGDQNKSAKQCEDRKVAGSQSGSSDVKVRPTPGHLLCRQAEGSSRQHLVQMKRDEFYGTKQAEPRIEPRQGNFLEVPKFTTTTTVLGPWIPENQQGTIVETRHGYVMYVTHKAALAAVSSGKAGFQVCGSISDFAIEDLDETQKPFVVVEFREVGPKHFPVYVIVDRRGSHLANAIGRWVPLPKTWMDFSAATFDLYNNRRNLIFEGLLDIPLLFSNGSFANVVLSLNLGERTPVDGMQTLPKEMVGEICHLALGGLRYHEFLTMFGGYDQESSLLEAFSRNVRNKAQPNSCLVVGPSGAGKSTFVKRAGNPRILDGDKFVGWFHSDPELPHDRDLSDCGLVRRYRLGWALATTRIAVLVHSENKDCLDLWDAVCLKKCFYKPTFLHYVATSQSLGATPYQKGALRRYDAMRRCVEAYGWMEVNTSKDVESWLASEGYPTVNSSHENPSPPCSPPSWDEEAMTDGSKRKPFGFFDRLNTGETCDQEEMPAFESLFSDAEGHFAMLGGLHQDVVTARREAEEAAATLLAERAERYELQAACERAKSECSAQSLQLTNARASMAELEKERADIGTKLDIVLLDQQETTRKLEELGVVTPDAKLTSVVDVLRDTFSSHRAEIKELGAKQKTTLREVEQKLADSERRASEAHKEFEKSNQALATLSATASAEKGGCLNQIAELRSACEVARVKAGTADTNLMEAQRKLEAAKTAFGGLGIELDGVPPPEWSLQIDAFLAKSKEQQALEKERLLEQNETAKETAFRLEATIRQKDTAINEARLEAKRLAIEANKSNLDRQHLVEQIRLQRAELEKQPRRAEAMSTYANELTAQIRRQEGQISELTNHIRSANISVSAPMRPRETVHPERRSGHQGLQQFSDGDEKESGEKLVWFLGNVVIGISAGVLEELIRVYDTTPFRLATPTVLAMLEMGMWAVNSEYKAVAYAAAGHSFLALLAHFAWVWVSVVTHVIVNVLAMILQVNFLSTPLYWPAPYLLANPLFTIPSAVANWLGELLARTRGAKRRYSRRVSLINTAAIRGLQKSQKVGYSVGKAAAEEREVLTPGVIPLKDHLVPPRSGAPDQNTSRKEAFHPREGHFISTIYNYCGEMTGVTEERVACSKSFRIKLLSFERRLDESAGQASLSRYEAYLQKIRDGGGLAMTPIALAAVARCGHSCSYNAGAESVHKDLSTLGEDGHFSWASSRIHRQNEEHYGIRCGIHHSWLPHQWSPEAMATIFGGGQVSPVILEMAFEVGLELNRLLRETVKEGELIAVTSADSKYLKAKHPRWQGMAYTLLLVPDDDTMQHVKSDDPKLIILKVPVYVSMRSLAHWRGLIPQLARPGYDFMVFNADVGHLWFVARPLIEKYRKDCNKFSVCCWAHLPINMSCFFWKGGDTTGLAGNLYAFEALGFVYGSDEIVHLAFGDVVAVYNLPGQRGALLGRSQEVDLPVKTHAIITDGTKEIRIDSNRYDRFLQNVLANQDLASLAPPPYDPKVVSLKTPLGSENGSLAVLTAVEYDQLAWPAGNLYDAGNKSLQELVGPVFLFCFGTEGDVRPVVYGGSVLASYGFQVIVVKLLDETEALTVLEAAENSNSVESIPAYMRAMRRVSSCDAVHFCSTNLSSVNAIRYSLSPPPDVVFPTRAGIGPVLDWVKTLFDSLQEADFFVSCYRRDNHVPRGTGEGQKVTTKKNLGVYEVGLRLGSSNTEIPREYRAVRIIPRGDDLKEFPKYKTVICHGGAGTVQTAAACGCRVLVISDKVDRRYRLKTDAGRGVDASGDETRWLLPLMLIDPRLFRMYTWAACSRPGGPFFYTWRMAKAWFAGLCFAWKMQALITTFNIIYAVWVAAGLLVRSNWGFDPTSTLLLCLMPQHWGHAARWSLVSLSYLLLHALSKQLGVHWLWAVIGPTWRALGVINNKSFIPCVSIFGLPGILVTQIVSWLGPRLLIGIQIVSCTFLRAWRTRDLVGAPHGIYIEFWYTRNLGLFPIIHGRLIDKKRGLVYEGRHVADANLGAKFEAVRGKYDDSCERDKTRASFLFATSVTPERFDSAKLERHPYQPWWNCIAILIHFFTEREFTELGWLPLLVCMGMMIYATALVGFGILLLATVYVIVICVTWVFSLDVPEVLAEQGIGEGLLGLLDPRGYPGIGLQFQRVTLNVTRSLAYFGVVEEMVESVKYLDLAISDQHLRSRIDDLGLSFRGSLGVEAWKSVAGDYASRMIASYKTFNSVVDRDAFNAAVEDMKEKFTRDNFGSTAWSAYVRDKLERLATVAGQATSVAFDKWVSTTAQESLREDDGALETKISNFEAVWPVTRRFGSDYLRALDGFRSGIAETHDETIVHQVLDRLKPVALKTLLREGVSPLVRQEIGLMQAWRDRGVPDKTRNDDFKFRLEARVKDAVLGIELELLLKVAGKGFSQPIRKEILERDPGLSEPAPPGVAFDLVMQYLAMTGHPNGLGVTPENLAVIQNLLLSATDEDKGFAELLLRTSQSGAGSENYEKLLQAREEGSMSFDGDSRIVISQLGALVEMAKRAGFEENNAYEAALHTAKLYLESKELEADTRARDRAAILEEIQLRHRRGRPPTAGETLVQWWIRLEQYAAGQPFLMEILGVVATLITNARQLVFQYAVELLDAMLGALLKLKAKRELDAFDTVMKFAVDAADILGSRLRVRPKVVWAPLYRRQGKPLSRAEQLALEIHGPVGDAKGYKEDLDATISLLEKHYAGDDDMPELLRSYVRPAFRPRTAFGTAREFEGVENAPDLLDPGGILEARVASYAARGVKQGLDGVYLANEDSNLQSLSRYEPSGFVSDPGVEALVLRCAEALYNQYPELFKAPRMSTPEAVAAYIEKRYSPGIPFIGRYSTRAAMFNAGWGKAIIEASKECLRTGFYPQIQNHAFPKMQVVDKGKLFAGKPVRTVVAQDLLTTFLDQALFLERSKRPASVEAGIASGRPLTEAGMRDFFEAVVSHQRFFKADEREYDSRTPPSIMAGLVRLAELGFDGTANAEAKKAWTATRYLRLQQSYITELEGGQILRKRRGGSTGQALTSWDNTMGVKLKAMAAWAIATGREPEKFFDFNTFINMSDDNMWGTSDDSLDPRDLVMIYEQFFGGELEIESHNNLDELMFLGKMIEPGAKHAADYEEVGAPVPRFSIRADVSNLLMRRSAFTTRVAGFREEQHMRARLQRTVGHALLCAHNRSLYHEMANEWMEDARIYLLRSKGEGLFDIICDRDGHIVAAQLRDDIRPASRADATRLNFLRKAGRLLGYFDVIRAELNEVELAKLDARHAKIMKLQKPSALGEYSRIILGTARNVISIGTPQWAMSLASEPDVETGIVPFYVPDFRAELFVYLSLVAEVDNEDEITTSLLMSRAKEAPYRYVLDIPGFMYYKNTIEGAAKLSTVTFEEAQNYVVAVTLFYVMFNSVTEAVASKYDWANAVLEAYNVVTLDLPRIYSVTNTVFWHMKGRSSVGVSSLQPRDPYLHVKQASRVAAFLVRHLMPSSNVPAQWKDWTAELLDKGARFLAFGPARKLTMDVSKNMTRLAEWRSVGEVFLESLKTDKPYEILRSATGTGKSREFIAALYHSTAGQSCHRVWLVVPRNILKNNYNNPDIPDQDIVKIDRDTVVQGQRLVISTYGALLSRLNKLDSSEWILACDEFHEGTTEQVAVEFLTRSFKRVFISATPRMKLFPHLQKVLVSPVASKYKVEYVPLQGDVFALFQEARRLHPERVGRALVIQPSIREAQETQLKMQATGYETHIVSKFHPIAPPTGVLIATQVVDSGLTISPPPSIVICDKEAIITDRGITQRAVVSASTLTQRAGRTGRLGDGLCYHHPDAGQGPEQEPYPPMGLYLSQKPLHEHFKRLHQIVETIGPVPGDNYMITETHDPCVIAIATIDQEPEELRSRVLASLRAYYLIISYVEDHDVGRKIYIDFTVRNLMGEAAAPVESQVRLLQTQFGLLEWSAMINRLDASPYITVVGGRRVPHCGLKLVLNGVVTIGTPSQQKTFMLNRNTR